LPRMFMPAPWITSTLGISSSVGKRVPYSSGPRGAVVG
jgi:hypothetical protein